MINFTLRNRQIDLLRGIAILLVLILHFQLAYHLDQSALNKIFSVSFIEALSGNGNYGVTMFFVISGFLITSMALERYGTLGQVDPIGFYILRFARIMPCLVLALAIIVLLSLSPLHISANKPNTTSLALAVFSVLTFWHNVLMQKVGYFNYALNIYWSLSVEEVFYIAFPLLCLSLKKTRFLMLFWIVLIILAPIYRSFYTTNDIVALYGYLSCFDAIAIGCCTAIIAQRVHLKVKLRKAIQWAAGLTLVTVYFYKGIMDNVILGVSLIAISTAVLLIAAIQENNETQRTTNLFVRIVGWFGRNSYELYLFHIVVLAIMKKIYSAQVLGDYSKLLWMAVFFASSALLAGSISRFYSQPLNKKLRKLLSSLRQPDKLIPETHPDKIT